MHRHGYRGRKFGRERDQRRALMKSLCISLIEHGSIETTLPKAKDLRPILEKLISKARKGDLHNRRLIISRLGSVPATNRLVDEIAPQISRTSGYLRIKKSGFRRGDNAEMAIISFVDDLSKQKTKSSTPKASTNKEEAKPAPTARSAPKKTKSESDKVVKSAIKKPTKKGDKK